MSDLRIKSCVLGQVGTNCYIVYDRSVKEAVIVDPGDNAPYVSNLCRELGVMPVAILLTHGHFDHIMAVDELRRTFHIDVYVSELDEEMLENPAINMSWGFLQEETALKADRLFKDGDVLKLIGYDWRVIGTPGHTAGSVCFWIEAEKALFSGDTLFEESYGRVDLPTASPRDMVGSILDRLMKLPDETTVYPGHGNTTTIGHERDYNPIAVCRR